MEMSNAAERRDQLEKVGTDVHSTLEGLSLKLEEARLHLERGEDSSHPAKGVQYAEGAYRLVAAELEELAETLRAAAAEEGEGGSASRDGEAA